VIVYRFEDLRVWQAAKRQSDELGRLLKRRPFLGDREIAGQMNAAALSVMFNIDEGFLRRRDKETGQLKTDDPRANRGGPRPKNQGPGTN
jgi:23S rRNA-intervening sequence protein